MKARKIPPPRIWVLLARKAPVGVIFRRGPSRAVQMIRWNLEDDSFMAGQWFRGRIYERRCDLSGDGRYLIYFAAAWNKPPQTWTAISKPPYFTALALWPKGDAWNGGGYFYDGGKIHLDHGEFQALPHPGFTAGCRRFTPKTFATIGGEDWPMWEHALARSGWTQTEEGRWGACDRDAAASWKAEVPPIWRKANRNGKLILELAIEGIGARNGRWYVIRYRVLGHGDENYDLGLIDWADWDRNGDLLYVREGCIFREARGELGKAEPRALIDLTPNCFEHVEAPSWATRID